MWRFIILLFSVAILALVVRNIAMLLRGYRRPRKSLPPRKPEPDIQDADFRETGSSDG